MKNNLLLDKYAINTTPFDLAVMETVETIAATKAIHKKVILADLGINHTAWAKMLKHERNVSTKPDRQAEIISILKGKYDVDPSYIRHFPNHPAMYLTAMVKDDGGAFSVKKEGSIKSLQKSLRDCEKLINKLIAEKDLLLQELSRHKETIENDRLLISALKKAAKNPAKGTENTDGD
jgi:hypothetical protein